MTFGSRGPSSARSSFRVRRRPPGLTIIACGKSTWPAISGSTTTVAPGVPPASGSCRGFASTWTFIAADITQNGSPIGLRAGG